VVVDADALPPDLTTAVTVRSPLVRAARATVVVVAAVPIVIYLYVALRQLGYPYELEWMEGGAVEIVGRVLHGQAIYTAPSIHYVPYAYTPLYFWVSGLVAHVTGLSFLPLRLVSFGASLGCFALLFGLVWRETNDVVAGIVAAGMFAATYQVGGAWLDIGRVDSLLLLFLLVSVVVARRIERWPGGVVLGLCVSAAFLTKQSGLLALLPLLAYLCVARRRVGVPALITVVVVVVGSTLILDAVSSGWYRYYVFGELIHQGSIESVWWRFLPGDIVGRVGWMLAVGVVGLVVGWRRRADTTAWAFYVAVVLGFVGASFISRLHSGGGQEVLLPAFAAIALLAGLGYSSLVRRPSAHSALVGGVVAAVLLVQVVAISGHPSHLVPTAADQAVGRRFVATVAHTKGQVLILNHPWYDTLAGKESWAQGEAIHDVLRAGPSAARRDLVASIDATLATPQVKVIYADSDVLGVFAGPIARSYQLGGPVFSCYRCFFPVTDVPFRPYLRFVRR